MNISESLTSSGQVSNVFHTCGKHRQTFQLVVKGESFYLLSFYALRSMFDESGHSFQTNRSLYGIFVESFKKNVQIFFLSPSIILEETKNQKLCPNIYKTRYFIFRSIPSRVIKF